MKKITFWTIVWAVMVASIFLGIITVILNQIFNR